jgi:hypothetical protein
LDREKYFIVVLGLYARHEFEQFGQKVVVVFGPAQLAKRVEMVVHDLGDVPVVRLFLVVVDVHHAQRWALLLHRNPLIGPRVRDVLDLHKQFIAFGHEFVDLDGDTRHAVAAACHVQREFYVAPYLHVLVDKVLQVRVFVHLRDQSRQEVG